MTSSLVAKLLLVCQLVLQLQLPRICWRGLMTIGVQGDDASSRAAFAELRSMLDQCQREFGLEDFDQLSMGMSND